jgi:hypothetical protein
MPSDEVRIAQTVGRMLGGELAAIDYVRAELRPTVHRLFVDAVRDGRSAQGVESARP